MEEGGGAAESRETPATRLTAGYREGAVPRAAVILVPPAGGLVDVARAVAREGRRVCVRRELADEVAKLIVVGVHGEGAALRAARVAKGRTRGIAGGSRMTLT